MLGYCLRGLGLLHGGKLSLKRGTVFRLKMTCVRKDISYRKPTGQREVEENEDHDSRV